MGRSFARIALLSFFLVAPQKYSFAKIRHKYQTRTIKRQPHKATTDLLWDVCPRISLDQKLFEKLVRQVRVPTYIRVANVKLVLTNRARHKVQKEIIKHFSYKKSLERLISLANLHLPVVDKIFHENKFPLDLKWLMVLESACVGNAKSNSRDPAVGYWQFKSQAARGVGLKINNDIDERMNLVTSTYGFMRYINNANKKFNNYVFALMSFYLGLKGAEDMFNNLKVRNSKVVKLDHQWHFYIYMFLAYKIIFDKIMPHIPRSKVRLCGALKCNGMSIQAICRRYKRNVEVFHVLNRWLKINYVPKDNENTVIVLSKH